MNIDKKINKFFKNDKNDLIDIQIYIKDKKNKFCRNTELTEFLGNFDNLLLVCKKCHNWIHSKKNTNREFISKC
jgi:hypothetical protein